MYQMGIPFAIWLSTIKFLKRKIAEAGRMVQNMKLISLPHQNRFFLHCSISCPKLTHIKHVYSQENFNGTQTLIKKRGYIIYTKCFYRISNGKFYPSLGRPRLEPIKKHVINKKHNKQIDTLITSLTVWYVSCIYLT